MPGRRRCGRAVETGYPQRGRTAKRRFEDEAAVENARHGLSPPPASKPKGHRLRVRETFPEVSRYRGYPAPGRALTGLTFGRSCGERYRGTSCQPGEAALQESGRKLPIRNRRTKGTLRLRRPPHCHPQGALAQRLGGGGTRMPESGVACRIAVRKSWALPTSSIDSIEAWMTRSGAASGECLI